MSDSHDLTGIWHSTAGSMQLNADGTALVDGQWFRYTADGATFTLIGTRASVPIPYQLDGDTLTYVVNGQTMTARRIPQATIDGLREAVGRGAGVWVGSESSVDPSLVIVWTQYLTLYPDGTVDHASSNMGASRQQVTEYTERFLYSREANAAAGRMGRWQSQGANIVIHWNNGSVWQGQIDVTAGKMMFFGIGRLEEGSNVLFERQ